MEATREVEIGEIEQELNRRWRELTQPGTGNAQAAPMLRTCTLNLVVAGCGREQENLASILGEVTADHPARCLVVATGDEGVEARPRAWVNITCRAGGRGLPQVCSEHVILQTPGSALHQVIGSIAGLLVADLPTFLWWRGRLPSADIERERFDHLARVADRLIIDSLAFPAADIARVVELRRLYADLLLGDLNWARLTPWRAVVAQAFDPPAMQEQLGHLNRATVTHAGSEPSAAVRLMAGWLQSRLQPSLEVELIGSGVEVFEVALPTGAVRVPRPAQPSEAQALSEELRILGRDLVFEQALSAALSAE